MKIPRVVYIPLTYAAVIVGLGTIGTWAWKSRVRADERRVIEHAAAKADAARHKARGDSLAALLAVKQETLTIRTDRWRTLAGRVDTAWLRDTVIRTVPVEVVREVVRSADSTIHACTDAVSTCELLVAARDSTIRAKDRVIAAMPRAPSPWRLRAERVGWIALTAYLARR